MMLSGARMRTGLMIRAHRCWGPRPVVSGLCGRELVARRRLGGASARFTTREQQVLRALMKVPDPESPAGQDVVYTGRVQSVRVDETTGKVAVFLPLDDHYRRLKAECQAAVSAATLPWLTSVRVELRPTSPPQPPAAAAAAPEKKKPTASDLRPLSLGRVRRVLAVSSCKGGVGKSTVAVNLAFSMKKLGLRVGLLDADVYGPSLPTMVRPPGGPVVLRQDPATGLVAPPVFDGVPLMSYGFTEAGGQQQAAIMRGPMVSNVVQQLALLTDWGALDYLVVDMPPGTGDIQLTLAQQLPLVAAVVVTTPQRLALVDVVRGIEMFGRLRVPVAAVVENMAYFVCDGCSKRHRPMGESALTGLKRQFGIERSYEVPMLGLLSRAGDSGLPAVLDPEAPADLLDVYLRAAREVHSEVERLSGPDVVAARPRVEVAQGSDGRVLVLDYPHSPERPARRLAAADVRRMCQCAKCVDETTGRPLLDPALVADNVRAVTVYPMGNYAVSVTWSDGHTSSVYPYSMLEG